MMITNTNATLFTRSQAACLFQGLIEDLQRQTPGLSFLDAWDRAKQNEPGIWARATRDDLPTGHTVQLSGSEAAEAGSDYKSAFAKEVGGGADPVAAHAFLIAKNPALINRLRLQKNPPGAPEPLANVTTAARQREYGRAFREAVYAGADALIAHRKAFASL